MLLNTNEETAEVGALYVRFMIDTLWKDRRVGSEKSGRVLLYDRKDGMGSGMRRISPLLQILVEFVVGSTTSSSLSENEETAKVEKENSNLRAVLIERVNSVSSTLSLASLGLFGSLLDLNVPHVSKILISNYFKSHQVSTSPITYFLDDGNDVTNHNLDAPLTLGVAATRFLNLFEGTSWPSASDKSLAAYLYVSCVFEIVQFSQQHPILKKKNTTGTTHNPDRLLYNVSVHSDGSLWRKQQQQQLMMVRTSKVLRRVHLSRVCLISWRTF